MSAIVSNSFILFLKNGWNNMLAMEELKMIKFQPSGTN